MRIGSMIEISDDRTYYQQRHEIEDYINNELDYKLAKEIGKHVHAAEYVDEDRQVTIYTKNFYMFTDYSINKLYNEILDELYDESIEVVNFIFNKIKSRDFI